MNGTPVLLDFWDITRTGLSKAGLDRTYFKIFAIGFNKTATLSLDTLFQDLGFANSCHNTKWRSRRAHLTRWRKRAFSDGPPEDFRRLDSHYPRSKFILNTRDPLEWLDSRYQHYKLMEQQHGPQSHVFWRPTPDSVEKWVHGRNRYHIDVLSHFRDRPDDLLVVNYIRDPDAAGKVAAFLDLPGDWSKPYSRSTEKTREQGKIKNWDVIEPVLTGLGIPESDWTFDLYFPSLSPDVPYPADSSQLPVAGD